MANSIKAQDVMALPQKLKICFWAGKIFLLTFGFYDGIISFVRRFAGVSELVDEQD